MAAYLKLIPTQRLSTGHRFTPAAATPRQEPVPASQPSPIEAVGEPVTPPLRSPIEAVGEPVTPPQPPPIAPIRGPVTAAGYEGHINLTGVHFSLTVPIDKAKVADGSPNPTQFGADAIELRGGPPTLGPIVITKRMDRSSVALLEAATQAIPLMAEIAFTTGGQDDQTQYCTIFLDRALVSQADSAWDGGEGFPVEQWVFHYERIDWTFQPFVEDEPAHHYSWDLRRAAAGQGAMGFAE